MQRLIVFGLVLALEAPASANVSFLYKCFGSEPEWEAEITGFPALKLRVGDERERTVEIGMQKYQGHPDERGMAFRGISDPTRLYVVRGVVCDYEEEETMHPFVGILEHKGKALFGCCDEVKEQFATVIQQGKKAFMREEPVMGSSVIAKPGKGRTMRILAKTGAWWRVFYRDRLGWIHSDAIKLK